MWPSTTAAPSAWSPTPTTLALLPCASAKGTAFPQAFIFAFCFAASRGTSNSPPIAACCCAPDQTVAVAAAMIRVFSENGDRTDRKKARLEISRRPMGRGEVSRRDREAAGLSADSCCRRRMRTASCHRSRRTHRRSSRSASPICTTSVFRFRWAASGRSRCWLWRMLPSKYGSGEMRLTVWQNLLIPNIPV